MTNIDKLQIDKLHDAVEHINSGIRTKTQGCAWIKSNQRRYGSPSYMRQLGISTAYVELMLNEVLLGDHKNQYLYVAENTKMAEVTLKKFYDRLRAEGIVVTVRHPDSLLIENGQKFRAVSINQITSYHAVRGCDYDRVFCDVDLRLRSVDFVKRFNGELFLCLVSREGDMV